VNQHDRLTALRAKLSEQKLDGYILATGDEHITEFVAPYAKRLEWLTGFAGTTASIAVLATKAAIFVDSRYTTAVRTQVSAKSWSYEDVPQTGVGAWIANHAADSARIGYDANLFTRAALSAIEKELGPEVELVAMTANPVDALWTGQPPRPSSPAFVYPIELAGKTSSDKRRDIAEWLERQGADACVLTALDSIAWLLNVRGADIEFAPLIFSFAVCHRNGTADWFVDGTKINKAVREHLGEDVRVHPYEAITDALERMSDKLVMLDPLSTPEAIYAALASGGARTRDDRDPTVLAKAIKNPTEIEGMRKALIDDGAAVTRFLHWFSIEAPKGELTELVAAAKLNGFRREARGFHSLACDPISAADGNAAIPHYWPTPETDARIAPDSIYLVDSGGQYFGATTDITRTVAVGSARAEVKDRFTRVLKGHIALGTSRFPAGMPGSRLDTIARTPLWDAGLDCIHSIGHGTGAFLNIHEGPAYFSPIPRPGEAGIEAGMVLTNEPGYYKVGEYGIRTENQVVAVEVEVDGGDLKTLGFESLTFAPIDRHLIDPGLLTSDEIEWLDDYHMQVLQKVGPLVPAETREWLELQTAPIRS
jgi:Xaa-Pro aminopeptidase